MTGRTSRLGYAAAAALTALLLVAPATAAELERFFGTYVGVAEVKDLEGGQTYRRDMDVVIEPYQRTGFRIRWINVTLVDGRRDVEGVKRRVQEVIFKPRGDDGLFVAVPPQDPFREADPHEPLRGDAVRWARIQGDHLHVYSFVVLPSGAYEIQDYDRELTDKGIDIEFRRVVDGELVREITGTTVRAD